MKAAVVVGFNDIQYIDQPDPHTNSGQVKVAVKYCGICGSDIPRVLNGACHSFPQVLGHEFSGIVTEVAQDVTSIKVGDHVVGIPLIPCMNCKDCNNGNYSLCKHYSFVGSRQQGAMAEFIVLPEQNVLRIDPAIPLDFAALFEPATVALHALIQAKYKPTSNDKVCIIGAGIIALFTLQWCKIFGAKEVTVIGRSVDGLKLADKYGATNIISTLDKDFMNSVDIITSNNGYSYIFDAAGTDKTIPLSFKIASNKATICYIGTPTSNVEFDIKTWELINRKELLLTGTWMSYSDPWPGAEWQTTAQYVSSKELIIDENMINSYYPLNNVKDAFATYENNKHRINGRILLKIVNSVQ